MDRTSPRQVSTSRTARTAYSSAEHGEPQRFHLVRLRDDTFMFTGGVVAFIGGDRIEFLHTGRANPVVRR